MGVSLKFEDVNDDTTLEVSANNETKCIFIFMENEDSYIPMELDKQTAIKLSKELRKQIALID